MRFAVPSLYACDLCGRTVDDQDVCFAFLPSLQYEGRHTTAIIMDFCSEHHAREYWRGSAQYGRVRFISEAAGNRTH